MVMTKFGWNGEVLRKAEITYTIEGGDPRDLGFQISTDHNEEMCLISPEGRILAVGAGLTVGSVRITRRLGGNQQKDIGSGAKQIKGGGELLMGDKSPKKETKKKKKDKKK